MNHIAGILHIRDESLQAIRLHCYRQTTTKKRNNTCTWNTQEQTQDKHRTIKPWSRLLYDIRLGNRVDLFFQPRSPACLTKLKLFNPENLEKNEILEKW